MTTSFDFFVSATLYINSSFSAPERFELEAEKVDKFLARRGFFKCKMKESTGYLVYGNQNDEGNYIRGQYTVLYFKPKQAS